ncbi:MAG: IS1595 family transposase [Acidobacteria bacterium]|nr:IS1595 family transposase [Acidobacteriota bacterium]
MEAPRTLQQAIVYFADPDRAFEYAKKFRWPNGKVICPRCGKDKHSFIKTRKIWFCYTCQKQFTLKLATIFEDSPLGLDKWMTAFWMLVNCKNGVSSCEVARTLGITQKSAWFMLQRLRLALRDEFYGSKLGGGGGEVEVDETFIGGKARNMHKAKRIKTKVREGNFGKTIVMGMLERGGHVKAKVIPNRKKPALHGAIAEVIAHGANIYTDEHVGYMDISPEYVHSIVNHLERYVNGGVHTNGMENFWSLLKRGLGGTYVSVEPFHLFRYLDEQMFRFNNRKNISDSQRFALAMSNIGAKRLTYSELTGKDESPRHEATGAGETQIPF